VAATTNYESLFTNPRGNQGRSNGRGVGRGGGVGRGLGVGVARGVGVGVGVGVGLDPVLLRIAPMSPTAVPLFESVKETP
jgi:hypothetical protein